MTEFLGEDQPSFLFREEPVVAVEDDRALAGDVADRAAHPVNENTLHHRNAGKVDDRLHVHRRFLVSVRRPRAVTGLIVARVSAPRKGPHSPDTITNRPRHRQWFRLHSLRGIIPKTP